MYVFMLKRAAETHAAADKGNQFSMLDDPAPQNPFLALTVEPLSKMLTSTFTLKVHSFCIFLRAQFRSWFRS